MAKKPKTQSGLLADSSKLPKKIAFSNNDEKPSWRIGLLEMVDPFGWHAIEKQKLIQIQGKLSNFEGLTWNEILVTNKHRNHSVEKYKIIKHAQDRLSELEQDDIDEVVSLRLSGQERIWGIRDQSVLRLLWWDPEHQICPSLKSHT